MRRIPLIVLLLAAIIVLVACQRDRDDGLPPMTPLEELPSPIPTTSAIVLVESPVVGVTLVLTTTPAAAIPISVTVTQVSPTAPVTVTVEAVARQALRIRGGPGLAYPIIGDLAATGRVSVLGRSPDGAWLRIECPVGLQGECWIIGDAMYWEFEAEGALPTSVAPPVPAPTPTPPCVVLPPSGWMSYSVAPNDTLSGIAGRYSTSVSTLQAVNCLAGDMIVVGSSIYVPGGPLPDSGARATPGTPVATPRPPGSVAPAASIKFVHPHQSSPGCPDESDEPVDIDPVTDLGIYFADDVGTKEFEITDLVCIWVATSDASQPVTVTIITPDNREVSLTPPIHADGAWSFLLEPGMPASTTGEIYRIRVGQGERELSDRVFSVTRAQAPTLRVVTWTVQPHQRVQTVFADFQVGERLYLYQLDLTAQIWNRLRDRHLRVVTADVNGEGVFYIDTYARDSGHCFVVDLENPQPTSANRYDKRVFAVGVSTKDCQ